MLTKQEKVIHMKDVTIMNVATISRRILICGMLTLALSSYSSGDDERQRVERSLHDFAMARDLGLIASLHQGGGPPRTPEGWQVLQDPPAPNRKHWSRV